ncbi:uncharacterized protein [Dermacentor albipictus]|uniref:uncharacterized protein isoform X2 n=1 Tax=Dermacentor albipictus TaxID=60249 RepID=UPI0038FCE16C
MVRRRLEWLVCWCALVAAVSVGYVHGHLLVDRSAKQRVQALLAHQNPISALRTSAPVSPLGVTRSGPVAAAPAGSATPSRSGDARSGGSSSSYADTVRLLYSARDAREARIREPRVTPVLSQELEDVRSANEHFLRIRTTARCRVPRTRVVHVKEFYSDPSKEYLPRCTILHRCGDDSGCCDSEQYQCVPRAVQEVTLHFYTIHLQNQNGGEVALRNSVTKLLFPNHTECECQPVNDIPRTAARPSRIAHHSGEHNKVSLHAPSSEDADMAAGSGMHEELPSGPLKGGPPNLERPLRGSPPPPASLPPPELLLLLGTPPPPLPPPPPHNNSNSGQPQKRHHRLGILGEARPRRKSRAVRG